MKIVSRRLWRATTTISLRLKSFMKKPVFGKKKNKKKMEE